MADSRVLIEIVATGKGFKIVSNDINKTTKATNNLEKSQKKAAKTGNQYDKQNKGIYQTNLSSAKSFSKLNQTIGGSGGSGALVGSYAVLAANVFAVSAAFNALRGAMQVEKLAEGLTQFSNQTGMSLDLVAKKLQETTGFAVSMEQAMKTAALSVSAGFGVREMEGLTRVAKGASQALGRDMGDALDRLTRGAIKLEPEILDELGIMVRLDDATESYAATLGKSAAQLTRFERQQAFMNAIITEGEMKFGAIADAINPNVYDQLAATFADLAKDVINFVNGPLTLLIRYFLDAKTVFLGLITIFAGSIAKRMLPAFGSMTAAAVKANLAAAEGIAQSIKMGDAGAVSAQKLVRGYKDAPEAFNKIVVKLQEGTATTREMTTAQQQLTRTINKLGGKTEESYKKLSKAQQKVVNNLKDQRKHIVAIKTAQGGTAGKKAFDVATANLRLSEAELDIMGDSEKQTFTLAGTKDKYMGILKKTSAATKTYYTSLLKANGITKKSNFFNKLYRKGLAGLSSGFKFAAISAKVFGKALLSSIPFIGTIILVLGMAWDAIKRVAKMFGFFSDESAKAKEKVEELRTVIDQIPDKIKELADQQERATHLTTIMADKYQVMGGVAKTLADSMKIAAKAQQDAGSAISEDNLEGMGDGGSFNNKISATQIGSRAAKDARMIALEGIKDFPEMQKLLEESLGSSIDDMLVAKVSAVGLGKGLQTVFDIVFQGAEMFDGYSQALKGLGTTFQETEKAALKFFKTAIPTTKFDEIANSFSIIKKNVQDINSEAQGLGQTDAQRQEAIGEQAGARLGSSTAGIMGVEVFESRKRMVKQNAIIITQTQALNKAKAKGDDDEVDSLTKAIAANKLRYGVEKKNIGRLIELNIEEVEGLIKAAKVASSTFKTRSSFDKQRIKQVLKLAKNSDVLMAQRKVELAMDETRIDNLKRENKLSEAIVKALEAKPAGTLDPDDLEIVQNYKNNLEEIAKLNNKSSLIESENIEMRMEGLKVLQKQIGVLKEIQTLDTAISDLLLKRNSRLATGGDANGMQASTNQMNAASVAFDFAVQEAGIKHQIIAAEHELLKARVAVETAINNDKIKELGTSDPERTAGLKALNTALGKSVTISDNALKKQDEIIQKTIQKAALTLDGAFATTLGGMGLTFTQAGGATGMINALDQVFGKSMKENLDKQMTGLQEKLKNAETDDEKKAINAQITGVGAAQEELIPTSKIDQATQALSGMGLMIQDMFGEEGAVISAFAFMGSTFTDSIEGMSEGFAAFGEETESGTEAHSERMTKMADGLAAVGNIISSIGALSAASSKQRIGAVDQEIAAEKKKDGKSKDSLAKIAALEKKKEAMERKAFERNKKIQMASIIVNTAVAYMKTLGETGFFGIPLGAIILGMGAAQLAMVAGTSYQGGGSIGGGGAPSEISVGKRDNRVDTSKGASSGETAFLRGGAGVGSNANNFVPGAAAGMKSYASGGEVLVGERGPEIITPLSPFEVTPNDKIGGSSNVNFTINAVDAAGVEQLLVAQRGNIIGMIREAANEHGEEFMEGVNTNSYGGESI